jgi:hypothetical protein
MRQEFFLSLRNRSAPFLFLFFLFLTLTIGAVPNTAQTTQPFLFSSTYDSSTNTSGLVTLLRDGTTGVLAMEPNTAVTFKDPPSAPTPSPSI